MSDSHPPPSLLETDSDVPASDAPPSEAAIARGLVRAALFDEDEARPMVGRYRVTRRIGGGGMGEVFAATDDQLGRTVALKCVRSDRLSETSRARMIREARAMAKLSHPNVAAVHEVGEDRGQVFIVMEFVEGIDLARWAAQRQRNWREILRVYLQAGSALSAAHEAGLVHRDFKPHNAVLGTDGRVRVLDFGLVSDQAAPAELEGTLEETSGEVSTLDNAITGSRLTRSGGTVGSPAYMSPEQFLRRPAGPGSDQFSFCVSLHEALHGRRPFEGKTLAALCTNVTEGRLELGGGEATVPSWLRACLRRGLAVEPSDRWPSMDALLAALRRDPTRRRIALGLGIATVASVGAVFGFRAVEQRQAIARCDALGREVWDSWGPDQSAAIGHAFEELGQPLASDAWARTRPRLDDYAATWGEMQTSVCLAASLEGTVQGATADASQRCLERARAQLDTLVEALAAPDTAMAERAVRFAAALPLLAACEDEIRLDHLPPALADEEARVQVADAERQIARAASLSVLGQHDASIEVARRALAATEVIEHPPLMAEARYRLGESLAGAGTYTEAVEQLEEAFVLADGSGHDELALRVTTALTFEEVVHRGNHDRAQLWHDLGRARVERLGLAEHLDVARHLDSLGFLESGRGRYEPATEAFRQALAIKEAVLGSDHPSLCNTLNTLGSHYLELGSPADALAAHQRALEIAEHSLGGSHRSVTKSIFAIASVHAIEGEFRKALPLFERALAADEAALGPWHYDVATTLTNLGIAHEALGEIDEAEAAFGRSLDIWTREFGPDHPDVALALTNLASVRQEQGRNDEALAKHKQALAIWEKTLGPDHPEIATSLIHVGGLQRRQGELDAALGTYNRAHRILVDAMGPKHGYVAVAVLGIADVLRDRGDHSAALERYEEALQIRTDAEANPSDMADAQFDVARALLASGGDRERAVELAGRARDAYAASPREAERLHKVEAWLNAEAR